ncbi:MAG: S-adenosylmethionine decarboxylase [Desulfobacteria bacterium]
MAFPFGFKTGREDESNSAVEFCQERHKKGIDRTMGDTQGISFQRDESAGSNSHEAITQLNIDCYECKGDLNDKEAIVRMAENAATDVGATVLGKGSVSYPGRGITAVIFLAESHILVSTYPEYRYTIVEIFMSNSRTDPGECWNWLYEYLQPARMSVNRGVHYVGDGNGLALHKASGKLI